MANLEDVFRVSGVPTHTFVTPDRYSEIKVAIRAPGRCVVLEGPSGIGKTTIITKILEELELDSKPPILSGRNPDDIDVINELRNISEFGTVIIDDFHRIDEETKRDLSDLMKILADQGDLKRKIVLVGINKAGDQLIKYGNDLGLRIDIFRLEANSPEKILELIRLGEGALNIEIEQKEIVADRSQGSFQIAQLLCHKLCAKNNVTETCVENTKIDSAVENIIDDVMTDLGRQFKEATLAFARGTKLRREGKAPYLHILRWLSESDEGSIDLKEAMNNHPVLKGSVGQVVTKDFLVGLLKDDDKHALFSQILHYDASTYILGAEDPKFLFYLKNLVWRSFTKQCGFIGNFFDSKYEYALSFSGADRSIVEIVVKYLIEAELGVFYDFHEQHNILGLNVEEYLAPIYRSESRYVVPFLSKAYPERIWTKFESDQFRSRFGEGTVFPIRFSNVDQGFYNSENNVGSLVIDVTADQDQEAQRIVKVLIARIAEDRIEESRNVTNI